MRRLLHGFFAFAVLLGSIGAEPPANPAAPASHQDCCCGDEAQCPCGMPTAPRAPRCPSAPGPASVAVLPTGVRQAAPAQEKAEPRPWAGLADLATAFTPEPSGAGRLLPRDLPRPPDRSLDRLARLSTFRI